LLYLIVLTDFDFIFITVKLVKHKHVFNDAQILLLNLFSFMESDEMS